MIWWSLLIVAPEATALSFFLLGDWGKGGSTGSYGSLQADKVLLGGQQSYYQLSVAKSMSRYASSAESAPNFVVALGDNFYSNGVSSSTDSMWIPWYPVFGNHDYGGSTDAQIQRYYDHTDDDYWMFESQYYTKTFDISGGGSVAILFIDTTTLAPSETKYTSSQGGISSSTQSSRIQAQLSYINTTLASLTSPKNRPTWVFVAGHYPVFSAGEHGDISELNSYLQPLLDYYQIDAYFCGHDHISEHLQYNGVNHFVAGAGSMTDKLYGNSKASLLWYGVGYSAFAVVDVTQSEYTVQFIDTSNAQKYSYTVQNTRSVSTGTGTDQGGDDVAISTAAKQSMTVFTENALLTRVVCGGILAFALILMVFVVLYRRGAAKKATKAPPKLLATAMARTAGQRQQYSRLNHTDNTNRHADPHDVEQGNASQLAPLSSVGSLSGVSSTGASTPKKHKKLIKGVIKRGKNVYKAMRKIPDMLSPCRPNSSAANSPTSFRSDRDFRGSDEKYDSDGVGHRRSKSALV